MKKRMEDLFQKTVQGVTRHVFMGTFRASALIGLMNLEKESSTPPIALHFVTNKHFLFGSFRKDFVFLKILCIQH